MSTENSVFENTIQKDFPLLSHSSKNKRLVYLDSAATSLKPKKVIEAVRKYYEEYPANVHRGIYTLSEKATEEYEGAREKVRAFLNAGSSREIIFTHNATESINLVASSLASTLKEGDRILVSLAEHHSNFLPWQRLRDSKGLILNVVDIDDNGKLDLGAISRLITPRTKIAAFSHVSHVLGTINPVQEMARIFRERGVLFLVDAAQSAAHLSIDVQKIGCDFLAFSGHKIGGPTGIGVLYGREEILKAMDPFLLGGGMINEVEIDKTSWHELPWKFEAGTPHIAGAIGLGSAIDYINSIGFEKIREIDEKILEKTLSELEKVPGSKIFGPLDILKRSGIVSFSLAGIHPHDLATILDSEGVAIRAGHHCAMPLMKRLGVTATSRVSFWVYNTAEDINVLAGGIQKAVNMLKRYG